MIFFLIDISILLQKNAFGQFFFQISCMGSKVPFRENWKIAKMIFFFQRIIFLIFMFIHFLHFRMYTRLITRIETTCSRLGKDDKFQLFICLAVHDRLLGRIVTDLTKAVAAKQVKIYSFVQKSALLTWCLVLFIFQMYKKFWIYWKFYRKQNETR